MKKNLFPYLLRQSIMKSMQGAMLGALVFSALALLGFLAVQDFPTLERTSYAMLYGLYVLVLSISFSVAAGACFALWFYWNTLRRGFSTRKFVRNMLFLGVITWLGFFTVIVEPTALATWREFFTDHIFLGTFFDISSLLIGGCAGAWVGLSLKQELVRKNTLEPDLFSDCPEKINIKMHVHMAWQGASQAILSSLAANMAFAGLLSVYLSITGVTIDFQMIRSMGYLAAIGTLLSCIPAAVGGYALTAIVYQDVHCATATKDSSFLQGAAFGGLAAFGTCIFFGFLYATNPHTTSAAALTPAIMLATFLAFWAGGWTGIQLFKRIEKW
jgi:hypothetical protein